MSEHSLLSPSSAHRWMRCVGSVALSRGIEDTTSDYADEGTAAHELAAKVLERRIASAASAYTAEYLGQEILVPRKGRPAFKVVVDADMAGHVQTYVDSVTDYAAGNVLMVEQRVDYSNAIAVPEQTGTADAIVIADAGTELQLHDLKYGQGVQVEAENNEQLMLYALGALNDFGMLGDFERVRLVIHQPRRQHLSEWTCTVPELMRFAEKAKFEARRAVAVLNERPGAIVHHLNPGAKQCKFCRAKATCPKLTSHVLDTVADDFVDLTKPLNPQLQDAETRIANSDAEHLASILRELDLIESFCSAVRARCYADAINGREVPGFKLVAGREGNRKWSDATAAEEALKAMRVKHDQMYEYKVITPTKAEKLAKSEVIGPRQWPKLKGLITREPGKPALVPESDERPPISVDTAAVADEFESLV